MFNKVLGRLQHGNLLAFAEDKCSRCECIKPKEM